MSYSIVMPQLGLTMTEGAVSEWLKRPGELVQKNEALFIVSTEKAEMEVESMVAGTLTEIIVPPGETVLVGTTLAYLETVEQDAESDGVPPLPAEVIADIPPGKNSVAPTISTSVESPEAPARALDQGQVSPRAKRLAAELGVSLSALRGSGHSGRVVEEDVRRAAASSGSEPPRLNARRRQLIAERLTKSIQTIPAFSVSAEANAEELLLIRHHLQPPSTGNETKLTITDLLLAIFASVLKASPDLNATWEQDGPTPQSAVDIGLAVATEQGVVAPIIRNAAGLDLSQLAATRQDLVERSRRGKLTLPELEGGIATLSNLGMYRVDQFQAIISPGQSSILAIGSIRKRPWVDTTLVIKSTVILNLTVDHRIADGAAAATFLNKVIEIIEDPSRLEWQTGSLPGVTQERNAYNG